MAMRLRGETTQQRKYNENNVDSVDFSIVNTNKKDADHSKCVG